VSQQPASATRGSGGGSPSLAARIDVSQGSVELCGDLDRRTAPVLEEAVTGLLRVDRRSWRVHVAELLVWDLCGLRAIAEADRRMLGANRLVILLGASRQLRYTLELLRRDDRGPELACYG
jgi:anti-anti-sigma regulatory factor